MDYNFTCHPNLCYKLKCNCWVKLWEGTSKRRTCKDRVAPEVAPMSYPNSNPPSAGKKNLKFSEPNYFNRVVEQMIQSNPNSVTKTKSNPK